MRGGRGVGGASAIQLIPIRARKEEDAMSGKKEWAKEKYQPKPGMQGWQGKWIFCNATKQDLRWTPNGQDVTLTIGSTKVKLAPGERYAFQPKDNRPVTVKAKPMLSTAGMKNAEDSIGNPMTQEDYYVWIWASTSGAFKLGFSIKNQGAPR
jgi:hypothetical protein